MDAVDKVKRGMNMDEGTMVLFVIVTLLLIVFVIVYLVYRLKRGDLKSVAFLSQSTRLYNMKQTYRFDASQIPPTLNGQEFTFSFWLYLVEYPPLDSHALVFCRGGSGQSVDKSNPIVFLDKSTNKLHIAVRTTALPRKGLDPELQGNAVLDAVLARGSSFLTATIDFVPLQRWLHVAFTVQDNLLTVYLDGDVYTVSNLFMMKGATGARPVFAGTNGDVFVGALPGVTAQARAFVAKGQFFNFAVMQKEVGDLYSRGPAMPSVMGAVGLPSYGFRSPVYRLDA